MEKKSISLKNQLILLKIFIDMPEFKGKAIVNDIRMIAIASGHDYLVNELNSLKIVLPNNIGFEEGKWYPSRSQKNIKKLYEKLLKKGISFDVIIFKSHIYNEINKNKFLYLGFYISIKKSFNILGIEDYTQVIDFTLGIENIIKSYLKVIVSDKNDINENINGYYSEYVKYIEIKKNICVKSFKYKEEFINFYLDYKIYVFKNRIKFYKLLQNRGYANLNDILNKRIIKNDKLAYLKNISIEKDYYNGIVAKVFNTMSAMQMKENDIMVSSNTNPELMEAFIKSSFIIVESTSELSHAAITCKELSIPLALGASNIFLSTKNNDILNIDTINKIIILKQDYY